MPYRKALPRNKDINIRHVVGKSERKLLSQREVDNYQDCLNLVDTEYVIFMDADEFIHPKTLEILSEEKPQSMELPWMMMCISTDQETNSKGESLYKGILAPQRKTISRTKDILTPGVHRSKLKGNGKMINYARCKDTPLYHYYVRNNADLQEKNHASFAQIERRSGIDLIFQLMATEFCTEEHYIKLSEDKDAEITGEDFSFNSKFLSSQSLTYLNEYYKLLYRYTSFIGIVGNLLHVNINYSLIEGPRAALQRIRALDKLKYKPLKALYVILLALKKRPTKKDGG